MPDEPMKKDITHASKEEIKGRYNSLAMVNAAAEGRKCGCSPEAPSKKTFTIMSEDYSGRKGYVPEADLGVGCGLPTEYAGIKPGNTVVDLGSGAGNDCFIAREEAGSEGRVIGIDFATRMVERARENARKRGLDDVEFMEGDIEDMPPARRCGRRRGEQLRAQPASA